MRRDGGTMIDHRPKMVNDGGSTYSASTRIRTNKTVYEESSAYQKALEDLKNAESRPSAVGSVLGINPQTGAPSAGGAGGKLRANDLLPDAAPAAQAAGGVEVGGTETEEELDFDENLEPIVKSPYTSGSNTPRINGNPRKNAFSTEGLEEWQIDQMMKEVFGESESGFEAAGLSEEKQDAYWQRKEDRAAARARAGSGDAAQPPSGDAQANSAMDRMVSEIFDVPEKPVSQDDPAAFWDEASDADFLPPSAAEPFLVLQGSAQMPVVPNTEAIAPDVGYENTLQTGSGANAALDLTDVGQLTDQQTAQVVNLLVGRADAAEYFDPQERRRMAQMLAALTTDPDDEDALLGIQKMLQTVSVRVSFSAGNAELETAMIAASQRLGQDVALLRAQEAQALWQAQDEPYRKMMENPDFYARSMAGAQRTWESFGESDFRYLHQNVNDTAPIESKFKNEFIAYLLGSPADYARAQRENPYTYLEPEERAIFNYLLEKDGETAAAAYMAHLDAQLMQRRRAALDQTAADFAGEHPVLASIESVGLTLEKIPAYMATLVMHAAGQEIDENDVVFDAAARQWTIRQTVSDQIRTSHEGFWGEALAFLYDTGLSMGDSVLVMAAAGGGGLAAACMGASAAESAAYDALKRGATQNQAMAVGFWTGLTEVIFEKISLDELFGAGSPTKRRAIIQKALRQSKVEATEELCTEIANRFTDNMLMQEKSRYNQSIAYYVNAEGLSESEAVRHARRDMILDLGAAALGGGLSGFVMGGAKGTIDRYPGRINTAMAMSADENNAANIAAKTADEKYNGITSYDSNKNDVKKPYANSRPSYGKNQVNQVWENAKNPTTGKVFDPSGVELHWDTAKPRGGQWDMGHIPGEKYSEVHQLYMDDIINKEVFLEWYRDPANYRPELPKTNRSHKYE
jgi:hypothetical protein